MGNPDHEQITLPQTMMKSLNLYGSVTPGGAEAEISGDNMIYNYQQVLRQVTYTNLKPAYYLNRQFKIVCSQHNMRFTSNEYIQTLTVVHPSPGPASVPVYNSENILESKAAHRLVSQHNVDV